MRQVNATALAVEAAKTLLLDPEELLRAAEAAKIAMVGYVRR